MEIAITFTAAPHSKELLLDLAANLQRDLAGSLEFGWLSDGEALDLIGREFDSDAIHHLKGLAASAADLALLVSTSARFCSVTSIVTTPTALGFASATIRGKKESW